MQLGEYSFGSVPDPAKPAWESGNEIPTIDIYHALPMLWETDDYEEDEAEFAEKWFGITKELIVDIGRSIGGWTLLEIP